MKDFMKRRWAVFAAILILAGSMAIKNMLAGLKEPPKEDPPKNLVAPVSIRTISNLPQRALISVDGRILSQQKFEVFSEVTGRLLPSSKPFKDGTRFNKGDVLLKLDDTDMRMNLVSSRSAFQSTLTALLPDIKIDYEEQFERWQTYVKSFNPEQSIPDLPNIDNDKLNNFLVSKQVINQFYAIRSQEAQLKKFTVVAPFDGIVSSANVNPNTIIRAGQLVGVFVDPVNYELEAGISISQIDKIGIGDSVKLTSTDIQGEWMGKVSRKSEVVDANTQNVKTYISVSGNRLFEGMYMSGVIRGAQLDSSAVIPRYLVVNGNQVYIESDGQLRLMALNIIHDNKDQMIVKGLPDGTNLINQVVPGAFEGLQVEIIEQ